MSRSLGFVRSWSSGILGTPGAGARPIDASYGEEFTRFYETHWDQLFRYMHRLSGDLDLAADLSQEAFTRLLRRGSMPERPMPWLVTVAHNLHRDRKRTLVRRLKLLGGRTGAVALGDAPRSPDESAELEESRRRLRIALDELPEPVRRVLLLRAEGFKYREIAQATGVKVSSVGTMLIRATEALKTRLEDSHVAPD